MTRPLDAILPQRLGTDFRWLVGSSWASNLGDGLMMAAGPLLVASQTRSPALVAAAGLAQWLPQVVLGLYAGVLADRLNRKLLVIVADAVRILVLIGLVTVITTGHVSIGWVLTALFAHAVCEVFADTTAGTLTPMMVAKPDLGIANARLQAGYLTLNQMVGPPLGAWLFAIGVAVPFGVQLVCLGAALALMTRIQVPPVERTERSHLLREIGEGVRWLIGHSAMRTLAIVMFTFNVTWGAAWSVLVLYALDVLGMGSVGFGLLTTVGAIGGLVGTFGYGWLERKVPLATLMRGCLTLEVLTHLSLAINRSQWLAMVIMLVFGAYAFCWGTLSTAVRQRAVPMEFQGRVGSVYRVGLFAGLAVGAALGGVIGERFGVVGPFWFAFIGSGLTLAVVWRQLGHIAHADEAPPAPPAPTGPARS